MKNAFLARVDQLKREGINIRAQFVIASVYEKIEQQREVLTRIVPIHEDTLGKEAIAALTMLQVLMVAAMYALQVRGRIDG